MSKGRRNIVIGAVLGVVTVLAVIVGLQYDSSRALPVETSTANAITRIQPDAYYDAPWVYFVGDSYTEGTQFDSGRDSVWTNLVAAERGWFARNLGVGQAGYATNGRSGKAYTGQIEQSQLVDANAVVISGGINDVRGAASIDEIGARVSQTLTRVRAFAPTTPVTVLSVFDPYADVSPKMDAMNNILRAEAERIGATFVWATDLLRGNPALVATDELHPNDAGHAEIAAVIGPQLAEPTPRQPEN